MSGAERGRQEAATPGTGRERGFALLLVLWSMVLLTLLAIQVGLAGRSEATIAGNLRRAAVVQAATDGAVEEAAYHLLEPPPTRWAADGTAHELRTPGAVVTLRVTDEAGKVDLDTAPPALLAAVLGAAGASAADAAMLAARIVEWRFPTGAVGPDAPQNAPYLRAGLSYGPPGAPFESTDELGLVLGMTPALLAAVRPHVTTYGQGQFDASLADPVVRAAARQAGIGDGAGPGPTGQGLRTVSVVASGVAADGVRAGRRAVLRLGFHQGTFLRVLAWEAGP